MRNLISAALLVLFFLDVSANGQSAFHRTDRAGNLHISGAIRGEICHPRNILVDGTVYLAGDTVIKAGGSIIITAPVYGSTRFALPDYELNGRPGDFMTETLPQPGLDGANSYSLTLKTGIDQFCQERLLIDGDVFIGASILLDGQNGGRGGYGANGGYLEKCEFRSPQDGADGGEGGVAGNLVISARNIQIQPNVTISCVGGSGGDAGYGGTIPEHGRPTGGVRAPVGGKGGRGGDSGGMSLFAHETISALFANPNRPVRLLAGPGNGGFGGNGGTGINGGAGGDGGPIGEVDDGMWTPSRISIWGNVVDFRGTRFQPDDPNPIEIRWVSGAPGRGGNGGSGNVTDCTGCGCHSQDPCMGGTGGKPGNTPSFIFRDSSKRIEIRQQSSLIPGAQSAGLYLQNVNLIARGADGWSSAMGGGSDVTFRCVDGSPECPFNYGGPIQNGETPRGGGAADIEVTIWAAVDLNRRPWDESSPPPGAELVIQHSYFDVSGGNGGRGSDGVGGPGLFFCNGKPTCYVGSNGSFGGWGGEGGQIRFAFVGLKSEFFFHYDFFNRFAFPPYEFWNENDFNMSGANGGDGGSGGSPGGKRGLGAWGGRGGELQIVLTDETLRYPGYSGGRGNDGFNGSPCSQPGGGD